MVIGWIARILAGLYSNRRPGEVAAAIACAVVLALMPANNLLWYTLLILLFFVQVNQAVALVFIALLSPFSALVDPALHRVGYTILTIDSLHPFFTWLSNVPLMPFTRFNNSLVLGGLVVGLIAWIPVFLLSRILVMAFRLNVVPRIASSKPVQAIMKVPLVNKLAGATRHWYGVFQAVR